MRGWVFLWRGVCRAFYFFIRCLMDCEGVVFCRTWSEATRRGDVVLLFRFTTVPCCARVARHTGSTRARVRSRALCHLLSLLQEVLSGLTLKTNCFARFLAVMHYSITCGFELHAPQRTRHLQIADNHALCTRCCSSPLPNDVLQRQRHILNDGARHAQLLHAHRQRALGITIRHHLPPTERRPVFLNLADLLQADVAPFHELPSILLLLERRW